MHPRFHIALRIAKRERNEDKLRRDALVADRGKSATTWKNRLKAHVCVYTAEDAGVESDGPWIASCDTHNEMLSCSTKESAIKAAKSSNEWCGGCRARFSRE